MNLRHIFYIFAMLLISCEKATINQEQFSNPYNFVGLEHNLTLLNLNEDGKLNSENIAERWREVTNKLAKDKNIEQNRIPNYKIVQKQYLSINKLKSGSQYLSISAIADSLFNNKKISKYQYMYFYELDTVFRLNYGTTEFENRISKFEEEVSNDNRLDEEQKKAVYIAIAVAKYSENFWEDARLNPDNPYHSYFINTKSTNGWRAWLIGGSDVVGAIAGFFLTGGDPWGAVGLGGGASVLAWC